MEAAEALDRYLVQLQADGRSPHTVMQAQRHVRALISWLEAERRSTQIEAINHSVIASFLVSPAGTLRAPGVPRKAGTVNALRSSLRRYFRYAHDAGYVAHNAARLVRPARCSPAPPRGLTQAEVGRLLEAADESPKRDAVLVRLLLGTGLRLGSAVALSADDVDLDAGELHVRSAKGDQPIVMPLAPGVLEVLRSYLDGRGVGPLFPGRGGEPLTTRAAAYRIAQVAERAGLAGRVSAHRLRHAFAMRLYARTKDIAVVQRGLGHRSPTSTAVYARADLAVLRDALRI